MKTVAGTFNGTGAAVYICCGFIPDKVLVRNVEATDGFWAEWSRKYRSSEQIDGGMFGTAAGITLTVQTAGQGIQPYEGGDTLTTTNQTSVTYGEGVYLAFDRKDYKGVDITANSDAINAWTLGNSSNRTGNFNNDVTGTYIGEGSEIKIDGKWYVITALTAGQGISANEVTLSRAAPSGVVESITGMYDLAPLAVGKVTPAGFIVNNTTLNVNDNTMYFEASLYDN